MIGAFNRQLRKVTNNKTIFPTDFALVKSLYLAMSDASLKWTSRIRGWDKIISQLSIYFEGRIKKRNPKWQIYHLGFNKTTFKLLINSFN